MYKYSFSHHLFLNNFQWAHTNMHFQVGEHNITWKSVLIYFWTRKTISLFTTSCFVQLGGGEHPDETTLVCSRGSERFELMNLPWFCCFRLYPSLSNFCSLFWSNFCHECPSSAFEFLSTCKISNLTVKAELGCCLLHRSGRLTIERCILLCDENPLDYLSCAIVSTAKGPSDVVPIPGEALSALVQADSVSVSRTRIEGGSKAVSTIGTLALQRVRVIYSRTALLFWFDVK